jgi:hypothetical protein
MELKSQIDRIGHDASSVLPMRLTICVRRNKLRSLSNRNKFSSLNLKLGSDIEEYRMGVDSQSKGVPFERSLRCGTKGGEIISGPESINHGI